MVETPTSDLKEISTFRELLEHLEGQRVRIWTLTSSTVRGPEGGSIAFVGILTLGEDFAIIGDCTTSYWTAIPFADIAIIEVEADNEAELAQEAASEETGSEKRERAFEAFYQKIRQDRERGEREP